MYGILPFGNHPTLQLHIPVRHVAIGVGEGDSRLVHTHLLEVAKDLVGDGRAGLSTWIREVKLRGVAATLALICTNQSWA